MYYIINVVFKVMLYKLSGVEDIVFNFVVIGWMLVEFEKIVGLIFVILLFCDWIEDLNMLFVDFVKCVVVMVCEGFIN